MLNLFNFNHSSRQQLSRYVVAVFIIIFILLLDFLSFLEMSRLRTAIGNWQAYSFSKLQRIVQPVTEFKDLWKAKERLEDLEYRYRETVVQLGELAALREENTALRKILENSDRKLTKTIISRPISSFSKPVLALGEVTNVRKGAMVLGEGILLGLIDEIDFGQARVLLLKDMDQQGILAKTENGVKGIVKGNGREILFSEVSSEDELLVNQRILTIGQEGVAADILIGQISQLKDQHPESATQTAIVEQLVNFYELSLVEVQP